MGVWRRTENGIEKQLWFSEICGIWKTVRGSGGPSIPVVLLLRKSSLLLLESCCSLCENALMYAYFREECGQAYVWGIWEETIGWQLEWFWWILWASWQDTVAGVRGKTKAKKAMKETASTSSPDAEEEQPVRSIGLASEEESAKARFLKRF